MSNADRLILLLAHAVQQADGWHDEARGGPITEDPLMDEARAFLASNPDAIHAIVKVEGGFESVRQYLVDAMGITPPINRFDRLQVVHFRNGKPTEKCVLIEFHKDASDPHGYWVLRQKLTPSPDNSR